MSKEKEFLLKKQDKPVVTPQVETEVKKEVKKAKLSPVTKVSTNDFKVTEVTISTGFTLNLGNYESLRIDSFTKAEVAEGVDLDAVRLELHEQNIKFIEGVSNIKVTNNE